MQSRNYTKEEWALEKILECSQRLIKGVDNKNYENNRCTVELDDIEELEEWIKDLNSV